MDQVKGLTDQEVERRQRAYGLNVLVKKDKFALYREFVVSFFSPLILLLFGASLIAAFLGDFTSFIIIFLIVFLSGSITFFQHFKAEHAAEKLKEKVLLNATVIRGGQQKEIPFSQVTIGDVIILSVGDIIPADIKLFEEKEMSVDQSSLTGESFPVSKSVDPRGSKKSNIVYGGTHVVTGEAKGVVIAIGKQTELGKLSKQITTLKPQTAFDKGIHDFSILIVRLIFVLTIFVFGVNLIFHHNILQSFLFAVALAVGLTPELMPVIITIALSNGAILMEKKDVIVKYLPSIQNLGGMNILCTDKTGTLTENAITLSTYEDIHGEKSPLLLLYSKINSHFHSGFKNPIDKSILDYTKSLELRGFTKIDEIPFDFERKKLSVVVTDKKRQIILITKGASHSMLKSVTHYQHGAKTIAFSSQKLRALSKKMEKLNMQGFRTVVVGMKSIKKKEAYSPADETNLVFLGFLIFTDPIKKTVAASIKELEHLGISIKILTGDNELVTVKTCQDAGIPVDHILLGQHIDSLTIPQLQEKAKNTTIFANLNPEQKARVITALKNGKNVVGFLGDGINDAPPLKAADIGISVNNASDIAKDVADVILMRKSLSVLKDGVVEGRKTFSNSFKYILMGLSSNFGNMMTVAIASLFLPFLPLLPIQIILLDFLYDMSQITIPSDNVDKALTLSPQQWSISLLKRFTLFFGPVSSLFDILTFIILLLILHSTASVFRTGWFIESFITQTLIIFSIRTRIVPFFKSKPSLLIISSAFFTLACGIFLIFSPLGKYFSFVNVPPIFYIILAGEIIFYFICVEVAKLFFYKRLSS